MKNVAPLLLGIVGTTSSLLLPITALGGEWKQQHPNDLQPNLSAVSFVSSTVGWAAGLAGTIVRTTDGGASWGLQVSGTSVGLRAVHCVNATTGWIVGHGGTVLKTTDGQTWVAKASGTTDAGGVPSYP